MPWQALVPHPEPCGTCREGLFPDAHTSCIAGHEFSLAPVSVVTGCLAHRYIGELSLVGSRGAPAQEGQQTVRISTLDFWGNRVVR